MSPWEKGSDFWSEDSNYTNRETAFSPWPEYFFLRRPCEKSDLRRSAVRKFIKFTIYYHKLQIGRAHV